jgi:EmrB/QacA subfamily drug resistance transporter
MAILDTTIVNVAIDPLAQSLHTKLINIQWIVTGYILSIAVVAPLTGWAASRFGAKRLYIAALVVFTLGSALCGLATSAGLLIAFRVIQGVGGGAIAPVSQMMLVRVAGPRNLPRVMSAYGVPTILAPVFGPTVGGLLIVDAGWRSIFFVNVPIGIVAVILGLRRLPSERPETARRADLPGLGLAATGLVSLTYGLSQVGSSRESLTHVVLPIAGGVLLISAFVLQSLLVRYPLLDMRLYANKIFAGASLATLSLGGALVGNSILMPLYLQTIRHQDAFHTGLLVAPRGMGAIVGTWLSGRMMERLGIGLTAAIGCASVLAFTVPFITLGGETSFTFICLIQLIQGVGIGISIMPAMTAAYRALRPEQINDATPQLNIIMRVGSSTGAAILVAVLAHGLNGAGNSLPGHAKAFATTFVWLTGMTAVATIAAVCLVILERRHARALPAGESGLHVAAELEGGAGG